MPSGSLDESISQATHKMDEARDLSSPMGGGGGGTASQLKSLYKKNKKSLELNLKTLFFQGIIDMLERNSTNPAVHTRAVVCLIVRVASASEGVQTIYTSAVSKTASSHTFINVQGTILSSIPRRAAALKISQQILEKKVVGKNE